MFDVPTVTTVVEEVKNLNLEVDPELIQKSEEMMEEAKKNPNYIQEKQKEMQKAMKSKKK